MKSYDWHNVRARLKEAIQILPHFARHPVRSMRTLPDWDWPTILILQSAFAALTAMLTNLLERNFVLMVTSLIIAPITHALIVSVSAGFFYYVFKFWLERDVPYRQVWLNLVFAAIPVQIVLIVAPLFPPLMLAGSVASVILTYVGFTENFRLPRVAIRNLLGVLFVLYTALWVRQFLNMKSHHVRMKERATPESMDILEREINPSGEPGAN